VTRAPLVGREPQLAALARLLDDARGGASSLVAVTGPRGSGTTTLVRALAASYDGPVTTVRALPWEADRPLALWCRLLGTDTPAAGPIEAAGALLDLLEPGSLLVVDDTHLADPESLQAIASAAGNHAGPCFLGVLVEHPADRRTPARGPCPVRDLVDATVVVPPLTPAEVAELAATKGIPIDAADAERLHHHTGGLPRDVADLLAEADADRLRSADVPLPATERVREEVRAAWAGCPAETRALVEAAAVLADDSGVAVLAEAARLAGSDDPLPALAAADGLGLLSTSPRRGVTVVGPPTPLLAAAVSDVLGPVGVAALHRSAAEVVDDRLRAVEHLAAAALLPDASLADELEQMAVEQAATGAWSAAARLLVGASRLSIDRPTREDRLARGVDALVGAGDVPAALAHAAELESLRETPLRNAVLGYLAIHRGRSAEAAARLGRAWDLVNVDREPDVAALVSQRFVLHHLARCQGSELVAWADRALGLVDAGAPEALESAAIRGLGLAATGRRDEAVAAYDDLAGRVREGAQAQRIRMGKGWLHLTLDELDRARAELESAVSTDFEGGSTRISLWARAWLARTQFLTGDWAEALATVDRALALAERSGIRLVTPMLHWTAVQVHALGGRWEAADEGLRLGEAAIDDYELMRVPSHLAHAHHAEARADYAGVIEALRPLTQPWARGSVDMPGAWPWTDVYANALVVEGHLDEAAAFLDVHEARARELGHRSTSARLAYARGRLLGARGDVDAARCAFQAAIDLLSELPLRFDRARVDYAFGQTLRRAGKRREADEVLRRAREAYAALGATTYVARCDRELRAGGLHPVRSEAGEPRADDLTPQEQSVAALVAGGMSNREVAGELYLSVKTVQYHLTRIYGKLGIRSRTELAARWEGV